MARAVNFSEIEIFHVRFGIRVPKDIQMGGIAEKRCSQLEMHRIVDFTIRPDTG